MGKLIGLSGRARVGKDTVGSILKLSSAWHSSEYFKKRYPNQKDFILSSLNLHSKVAYEPSKYKTIAFADVLKGVLAFILGEDDIEKMYDELYKTSPNSLGLKDSEGNVYTVRELLQRLGTETGRVLDPNIWIKSTFNYMRNEYGYIITDVRFKNEAEACKEKGATLIRINREAPDMDHVSEHDLDDYDKFDYVIDNNGTLEELIDKVLQLNLV